MPDDIAAFLQLLLALSAPAIAPNASQPKTNDATIEWTRGKFLRKIRSYRFGIIDFDAELEWHKFRALTVGCCMLNISIVFLHLSTHFCSSILDSIQSAHSTQL